LCSGTAASLVGCPHLSGTPWEREGRHAKKGEERRGGKGEEGKERGADVGDRREGEKSKTLRGNSFKMV